MGKERYLPAPEPERIRRLAISSWEETKGMLELRTHNNERNHSLFLNSQDFLREYYNEVYQNFLEGKKIVKPDNTDLKNRIFSPHFRIIRETVTRKIEKHSVGWKKHIRREKFLASK